MRMLIYFSIALTILCLLGILSGGCAKSNGNPSKGHEIICLDSTNHDIVTQHVLTHGNVFAFTVKGYSVLCYRDLDNTQTKIIDISKNDCEVY